ncbi:MAG: dihydropteroate synthase, partial [Pseudomonadota bacterium]|nr:dihydropteroate synthase [Pseudomonadota bacterium]
MTKLVGIINITPDSFSDGGACFDADFAIQAIAQQVEDGANIIDIGAESTRPGAIPITAAEEWERLAPVLAALPHFDDADVHFSVDTRHAETAKRALAEGVHWINDVSGFSDPAMVEAVRNSKCKLVMMHSVSVPADKNMVMPESQDVMEALLMWARARIAALESAGIGRSRMIFDPGIGFGKTARQSLTILRDIGRFAALEVPVLIGHSRKSFLSAFGHSRDEATLVVSQYLAQAKLDYLRVHDVATHR